MIVSAVKLNSQWSCHNLKLYEWILPVNIYNNNQGVTPLLPTFNPSKPFSIICSIAVENAIMSLSWVISVPPFFVVKCTTGVPIWPIFFKLYLDRRSVALTPAERQGDFKDSPGLCLFSAKPKLQKRCYTNEYRESKQKRLKVFRLEAVRAGFKKAWQQRDYVTIIAVARKIPERILQEDSKLVMWYDQATTRMGED